MTKPAGSQTYTHTHTHTHTVCNGSLHRPHPSLLMQLFFLEIWVEIFNTWTLALFSVCGRAGCLLVPRYVFANANTYLLEGSTDWSRFDPCYIWNIPGNNHSSNSSVDLIFTLNLWEVTHLLIRLGLERSAVNVVLKLNWTCFCKNLSKLESCVGVLVV